MHFSIMIPVGELQWCIKRIVASQFTGSSICLFNRFFRLFRLTQFFKIPHYCPLARRIRWSLVLLLTKGPTVRTMHPLFRSHHPCRCYHPHQLISWDGMATLREPFVVILLPELKANCFFRKHLVHNRNRRKLYIHKFTAYISSDMRELRYTTVIRIRFLLSCIC